jgi:hypothetical protein
MASTTAQSQFLRVLDGTATIQRWQSYWVNQTVAWEGANWSYQSFTAGGITAGDVGAEGSMVIGVPITSVTLPALREALRQGYLIELRQYQFDPQLGNDQPQEDQLLVAAYLGEVIGLSGTYTRLEVEIGSALSSLGIQVPPRAMTSQIVGTPCQL